MSEQLICRDTIDFQKKVTRTKRLIHDATSLSPFAAHV